MEYTYKLDGINEICRVYVIGTMHRPEDSLKMKRLAIKLNADHGYFKFLFDLTKAEIVSSTMSIIESGTPSKELSDLLRPFKVAVLYRDITADALFFETVAVNRGYFVYAFDENKKAIEWLSDTPKKELNRIS